MEQGRTYNIRPSSSARWLVCTASAKAEAAVSPLSSFYASEGNLAHNWAEVMLKSRLSGTPGKAYQVFEDNVRKSGFYNPSMDEHVYEYVDFVQDLIKDYESVYGDVTYFIEHPLDLSAWGISEGTTDFVLRAGNVQVIVDFKYGEGVRVSAQGNTQQLLYHLGTGISDIENFESIIVQPRRGNISRWEFNSDFIAGWNASVLVPAINAIREDRGEYVPGGHCQFCKFRSKCKAYLEQYKGLSDLNDELLDDEGILDIYKRLDDIRGWANYIENLVYSQAQAGKTWEGLKWINTRGRRSITDKKALIEKFREYNYDPAVYLTLPELKPLTALEEAVGKKKFAGIAGDLVKAGPGAKKLVDINHPAPEVFNDTRKDFE